MDNIELTKLLKELLQKYNIDTTNLQILDELSNVGLYELEYIINVIHLQVRAMTKEENLARIENIIEEIK